MRTADDTPAIILVADDVHGMRDGIETLLCAEGIDEGDEVAIGQNVDLEGSCCPPIEREFNRRGQGFGRRAEES